MNALTPSGMILPITLADVMSQVEANARLTDTSRRDLLSSLRTVARLFGQHPNDIIANVQSLRAGLLQVSPRMHKISDKRFTNIKSDLAWALRIVRVLPRKQFKPASTAAWDEFRSHFTARQLYAGISNFVTYCLLCKIEPSDVNDSTLQRFTADREATSLGQSPYKVVRKTALIWNGAVKRNGLNLTVFQVPKSSRYRTVPLEDYPESLQKDIARYLERMQGTVLFADDGPPRPLRPMSIVKIQSDIRQTLDAAANAGASRDQFHSPADLVAPAVVKASLLWTVARRGGDIPVGLKNTVGTLLAIAKHYAKLPVEDIKALQNMRSQLGDDPVGMSDKNKVRLIQFDERRNVAALVTLPQKLLEKAKSQPPTKIRRYRCPLCSRDYIAARLPDADKEPCRTGYRGKSAPVR